ncbi:MAG TPA: methylenetetrahydrofolate reductase C-terminal domain-containing protein [Planctomycetota bacterium]|nr:methylenetetrahydrofolate reductase C-terminal domain-containing protein [Planctomycetota bacterium]
MIVADRKPLEEILKHVAGCGRILVLGCGGCVTVCASGGDRQAEHLAAQLRLAAKGQGRAVEVTVKTPTRQCDREFLEPLRADIGPADAVISLACGVGVQLLAEVFEAKPVYPALNTTFMGAHTGPGTWTENCRGCGQCVLAETAGVCPVARCAKSLVNGACGGTNKGKCEVSKEIDCAWYLIYKRLKARGDLSFLRAEREPLDWGKSSSGIRRTLVHPELTDTVPASAPAAPKS